jgi:Domain of unknown function (DUF4760)
MSAPGASTHDDKASVSSGATPADAQLAVQIMAAGIAAGADSGGEILFAYDSPPTLTQLREDHPRLSEQYRQVSAFLAQGETIATFVKHGVLNAALVDDLVWVAGAWKVAEQVCKGLREEAGEPRLYENFEWLAGSSS